MDRRSKLNDVYPDWKTGEGVFSLMQSYDPPWAEEFAGEEELLDYLYHGGVSGSKTISPLIRNFVAGNTPTQEEQTMIARLALTMFSASWTREYATLSAEYNPLENYNMIEDETPAETTDTERPAETTRILTPAETTETITPEETTETITPAETTETITPEETTETITPAEITETITPEETTETVTPAETTKTITPAAVTHTTRPAETTDTADRTDGIFGFNNSTAVSDPANDSKGKNVLTVQTAGTDVLSVQTAGSEADTTQEPGTRKLEVDAAGTRKLEVDAAETRKMEVDAAGTRKLEVDAAETRKLEVDAAGTRKLEVDEAGQDRLTVDTAGTKIFTVDTARHLERSGNIGVTTSQQMLQSERELWIWNFFRDVVFPDLDSVLVLGIY